MNPTRLYSFALRIYPRAFRRHYGREMMRVFEDAWGDAGAHGRMARARLVVRVGMDLLTSGVREQLASARWTPLGRAALVASIVIAIIWIDFHATEVQATLGALLVCNAAVAVVFPRRAWRAALVIGLALPLAHLAGFALHGTAVEPHPWLSRALIALPACAASLLGAWCGALAGRIVPKLRG